VYASSYKKEENIVKLDIDDEINTNSFQEKIPLMVILSPRGLPNNHFLIIYTYNLLYFRSIFFYGHLHPTFESHLVYTTI